MQQSIATVTGADRGDLDAELATMWTRLRTDAAIRTFAEERGIDLALVDSLGDETPFTTEVAGSQVREKGGGNLTVAETILVGIAVAQANKALEKSKLLDRMWDYLVEPALEKAGRVIRRVPKTEGAAAED